MSGIWAVFRQDFAGNEFLVEENLTEHRARELVVEYEAHKHHQHYWASEVLPSVDYVEMLRQLLATGSSLNASLLVVRNQNVTMMQSINAVRQIRNLTFAESSRIVRESPAYKDLQVNVDRNQASDSEDRCSN